MVNPINLPRTLRSSCELIKTYTNFIKATEYFLIYPLFSISPVRFAVSLSRLSLKRHRRKLHNLHAKHVQSGKRRGNRTGCSPYSRTIYIVLSRLDAFVSRPISSPRSRPTSRNVDIPSTFREPITPECFAIGRAFALVSRTQFIQDNLSQFATKTSSPWIKKKR